LEDAFKYIANAQAAYVTNAQVLEFVDGSSSSAPLVREKYQ
jgi:hypothetical protein